MSFYSDASLVMIPSGYKASKVYSAVPTDGAGDLDFTRALDTATRVGADGLIEKVRTNLYPSNIGAFVGYTLGPNASDGGQVAGPTGAMNARRIVMSVASNAFVNFTFTIPAAGTYTFSMFVRLVSGTSSNNPLLIAGGAAINMNALPTSTWTRVFGTFTTALTGAQVLTLPFYDSIATIEYSQIQWETGDIATPYIPTTTAAVSVGMLANVPRLDYLGGGCPKLLLEPQRTNLLQFSEQLNNAYWTPDGATITANTAVSPDGTTSMDRLTETATTNPHQVISTAVTIFGGGARTFSVFVKKGNVRYIQIANVAFGASSASSIFDLDTKTVTDNRASSGAGPAFSFLNSYVEDYGNGILRLVLVNTCSFDAPTYRIAHSNQATFTGATLVDGIVSYAGNASSFTDIWGCGLESASYATSYIPTLGAAVTRSADAASKTGISALIGQTEGTWYADITVLGNTGDATVLNSENVVTNAISLHIEGGAFRAYVFANSVNLNSIVGGAVVVGNSYRVAYAYKSGDAALYVNGVQVGTAAQSFAFTASIDKIEVADPDTFFSTQNAIKFSQALLFKTRLSNSQLAELTA